MSQKGSAFERKICKELSLWYTNGVSDAYFWRTAMSGGRATVRGRQGKKTANSAGDIGALDPAGAMLLKHITFELKKGYNNVQIQKIFETSNRTTSPRAFIDQAKESQKVAGSKYWMVIHKRDTTQAMVYMPYELLRDYLCWESTHLLVDMNLVDVFTSDERFVICSWKDWIDCISPDFFKNEPAERIEE
jgi:hypothetical protein